VTKSNKINIKIKINLFVTEYLLRVENKLLELDLIFDSLNVNLPMANAGINETTVVNNMKIGLRL